MDVCSLVNSKDISKYLKEINYEFSSLETAWLIYVCKRLSYEEKKALWRELIATTEDCEIPARLNCVHWESLHDFLKKYIEIVDGEISEFYQEKPEGEYLYMYQYLYRDDPCWTEEFNTIYPSLKKCLDAYESDVKDLDEIHYPDGTGVLKYALRRRTLSDPEKEFEIECFPNGQIIDVLRNDWLGDDEFEIISEFAGMWFDFPTPFKKGDILWVPFEDKLKYHLDIKFVLEALSTWSPIDFIRECGDSSDMNACGYFVNEDGSVYYEVMGCNYMDIEYYPGPFKRNEKVMPALGKYLKGEIPIDLLLYAYRTVLLDVASYVPFQFPDCMLEEIGLK